MRLSDWTTLDCQSALKIIERDLWDVVRADEAMRKDSEASTQDSARNLPCLRLQSIEIIWDAATSSQFVVGCLTDDRVLSFQINENSQLDRF